TLATVGFYVLGAAVLHQTAPNATDAELLPALADMYRHSLGEWSTLLFLAGALAVLYSTFFVATASNARLLIDAAGLLGVPGVAPSGSTEQRRRAIRNAGLFLPLASAAAYVVFPQPVTLVLIGAVGQGLMLPLLAGAAVYFRHRRLPPDLAPSAAWTAALWVSALLISVVGAYQLSTMVLR
ncbi:MAG: transmembrane Mn(2+) transporter, partial [Luteitalea sp.]